MDLCSTLGVLVGQRLRDRLDRMDRDEDEMMKEVAGQTYRDLGYTFDLIGDG